jgi:N-acetylneuraminic acid mutarotase
MSGDKTVPTSCDAGAGNCGLPGIYGVKSKFAATNLPGGRGWPATWPGLDGRLWLFGGRGFDAKGNFGYLNDFWVFDTTLNSNKGEWAWMGGSSSMPTVCGDQSDYCGSAGDYGAEYAFAAANIPSSRLAAITWTDENGKFWLFGGLGHDSTGRWGLLDDLWEFDPTVGAHGEWAWMGGSKYVPTSCAEESTLCGRPGVYGAEYSFADTNMPGGRMAGNVWMEADGKLWLFGGFASDTGSNVWPINDLWEFDPARGKHGQWAWMGGMKQSNAKIVYDTEYSFADSNTPGARYDSSTWTDSSGVFHLFAGDNGNERNDLWEFDPFRGAHGQWAWVGGTQNEAAPGFYGTLYQFGSSNIPGGREDAPTWTDLKGRHWLFGGYIGKPFNDLWVFDPSKGARGEWAWVGGSQTYNATGVYATQYTVDSRNYPGARDLAVSWTDPKGNLWLFGGQGIDSAGTLGYMNDLWEYQFDNLANQTITFPQPASPVTWGVKTITVSATASSGLPVTFTVVSGPAKAGGTDGATLTIKGTGTVVVAANQAGNSIYKNAVQVTRSITVKKAPLTVAATSLSFTYGATVPKLTCTITGLVNGETAAEAYSGTPKLSTPATSTSKPGTYPIAVSAGTLKSAHYRFVFKNGVMTVKPLGTVAKPSITPATGTYSGPQTVKITDATKKAVIHYTTDSSIPNDTSPVYEASFKVAKTTTVKAIASLAGYTNSPLATSTVTIK